MEKRHRLLRMHNHVSYGVFPLLLVGFHGHVRDVAAYRYFVWHILLFLLVNFIVNSDFGKTGNEKRIETFSVINPAVVWLFFCYVYNIGADILNGRLPFQISHTYLPDKVLASILIPFFIAVEVFRRTKLAISRSGSGKCQERGCGRIFCVKHPGFRKLSLSLMLVPLSLGLSVPLFRYLLNSETGNSFKWFLVISLFLLLLLNGLFLFSVLVKREVDSPHLAQVMFLLCAAGFIHTIGWRIHAETSVPLDVRIDHFKYQTGIVVSAIFCSFLAAVFLSGPISKGKAYFLPVAGFFPSFCFFLFDHNFASIQMDNSAQIKFWYIMIVVTLFLVLYVVLNSSISRIISNLSNKNGGYPVTKTRIDSGGGPVYFNQGDGACQMNSGPGSPVGDSSQRATGLEDHGTAFRQKEHLFFLTADLASYSRAQRENPVADHLVAQLFLNQEQRLRNFSWHVLTKREGDGLKCWARDGLELLWETDRLLGEVRQLQKAVPQIDGVRAILTFGEMTRTDWGGGFDYGGESITTAVRIDQPMKNHIRQQRASDPHGDPSQIWCTDSFRKLLEERHSKIHFDSIPSMEGDKGAPLPDLFRVLIG